MRNTLVLFLAVAAAGVGFFVARARTESKRADDLRAGWFRHPDEHMVTPVMVEKANALVDRPASVFKGPASDGNVYALDELVKERPLLLVFIKEDCPCSVEAQPFFNRLYRNYGDVATFLGVIDGGEAVAREWARRRKIEYPLLCDPELKVVRDYKAANSVYVALVAKGGKVDAYWPGISDEMLDELAGRLAKLTGTPEKRIDTTDAPDEMASGCPYPE